MGIWLLNVITAIIQAIVLVVYRTLDKIGRYTILKPHLSSTWLIAWFDSHPSCLGREPSESRLRVPIDTRKNDPLSLDKNRGNGRFC